MIFAFVLVHSESFCFHRYLRCFQINQDPESSTGKNQRFLELARFYALCLYKSNFNKTAGQKGGTKKWRPLLKLKITQTSFFRCKNIKSLTIWEEGFV